MESTAVVWFRNNLRLHDNPPLADAVASADTVVPLFVFDDRRFGETLFGQPRMSGYRSKFLWESIRDLRASLRDNGGDLVVRVGNAPVVISRIVSQTDADALYMETAIPGTDEQAVETAVTKQVSCETVPYWTRTLYHVNDLPTRYTSIADTFSSWRKPTQRNATIRDMAQTPDTIDIADGVDSGTVPEPDSFDLSHQPQAEMGFVEYEGGETAGKERVAQYIWEEDKLREYKQTRNELLGRDYSSKFSPWLAHGCVSPRYINHQRKEYERERVSNDSTYWLLFELMWRDFFTFQLAKHGSDFFDVSGIQETDKPWRTDMDDFQTWADGQTGIPFVDANMRELNKTGYMSNRGRQNVASFLTDVLDIDWRLGAAYFQSRLVDYHVASNWCNWAYVAGVGNDSRDDRYFNVVSQAQRYDSNAAYVTHWLPELDSLGEDTAHKPWTLNHGQQTLLGFELGTDYPEPMIDIENTSYSKLVSGQPY